MLIDRPQVVEGSSIQNATVQNGGTVAQNAIASLANVGELFYNTDLQQLVTYTGFLWDAIPSGLIFASHLADQALHLVPYQNTLLDGLSTSLLSTEINYLIGTTAPVQGQLNAITAVDATQNNTLVSLQNQITANQSSGTTALNNHIADYTLHITADQNTFLDALNLPALKAADINNVPTINTNLTSLTTSYNYHIVNYDQHLTPAENTFIDGINFAAVSPADVNRLGGINSYLGTISQATIGAALANLYSTRVSTAGDTMTGTLTLTGGATITGIPTPKNASDAVPRGYVDAFLNGIQWTLPVKAATTAQTTLSGLQIIDGIQLVVNDRVLVIYQTTPAENGVYVASTGAWSRAADYNTPADINNSALLVPAGAQNGKSSWIQTATVVNVGTDPIILSTFNGPTVTSAGNGIALAPSGVVSVLEGAGLTFVGSTLSIDLYPSAGLFTTLDGSTSSSAGNSQLALAPTGIVAGTYSNSGTSHNSFTVDSRGRLTSVGAAVTITPAFSSITGKPSTLAGYGITDAQPLNIELSALASITGTGFYVRTGAGASGTRALTVSGVGLSITNPDGVAGNPLISSNATSAASSLTLVSRDAGGNFGATTITAALIGNASTATALQTARSFSISGAAVGAAVGFNGTNNVTITVTALDANSLNGIVPIANLSGTYNINISGTSAATSSVPYAGVTGKPAAATWAAVGGDLISMALSWKNYGNNHIIFDASAGTSPTGSAIDKTAAQVPWTPSYPTLMGWNTANTFGVRVDSARVSDNTTGNAATANTATRANTLAANGSPGTGVLQFNYAGQGGQPTWLWGTNDGNNVYVWNPSNFSVAYAANAGNTSSIGNAVGNAYVWTGIQYFQSNKGASSYLGVNTTYTLEAYSSDAGAAAMSFHRAGQYAVNMGLDPDNVFRIGGFSAAANRLQMDMSGNLTMAGDVTAFSDARLKRDVTVITDALHKVQELRGVTFTRIEDQKRSTGVIAQEVQAVLPEAVHEAADGTLSVAYGNMVGLLIESIKELSAKVERLEAELAAR